MNIIRNFGFVTVLSLALLLLGGVSVSAQSTSTDQTVEELQAQIESLEQQVESLRSQIEAQEADMEDEEEEEESEEEEDDDETGTSTEERESLPPQAAEQARIARQLSMGDRGLDVQRLQKLLATNSEIYPEGLTTGYFGPLTSQAVTRLQERIGLTPDGQVGSTTLSEINTLLTEGAGRSGIIPPGLLKAQGLWSDMADEDSDDTGTSSDATSTDEEMDEDETEEADESEEEEAEEGSGMPDWDSSPIDNELKTRLKSTFGGQGQGGNPGQGRGQ